MYGHHQLKARIRRAPSDFSAEAMVEHILQDVHAIVNPTEEYDDVSIVVLPYLNACFWTDSSD